MQSQIDYLLGLMLDALREHGEHSVETKRAEKRLGVFLRSISNQG